MKVLLVNGSPHPQGCTFTALSEVASELEKQGIDTTMFQLWTQPIAGCIACGSCRKTGKCFRDDKVNEALALVPECDGFVFGSPVYYAGPNGSLCALLDRLFFSSKQHLQYKPAAAVAVCRRGGASATFDHLNKYFTISNMPVVPSQYWNSVHGLMPGDAELDAEGLQTMRTLARNMAWMLKALNADGVERPEREEPISTSFIRK